MQIDAGSGDTVGEALLGDLNPIVAFFGAAQTVEERVAVNNLDTKLVEDSDTVRLRRRFNQSGSDKLEERFVIDDVEPEPFVHGADRVDEEPGSAGLHDCGCHSRSVGGIEVECGLFGVTQFGFTGLDESDEVFRCVG